MLMKVTQHLRYLATCSLMSMTTGRTCQSFLCGGLGQSSGWSQRSGDVGASSGGTGLNMSTSTIFECMHIGFEMINM